MKKFRFALVIATLVSASCALVAQAPITYLATGGNRAAIEQLLPGFEEQHGYKVESRYIKHSTLTQEINDGTAFDVASLPEPWYKEVVKSGNVQPGSLVTLGVVYMGVAVKKGEPLPDTSTPEEAMKVLLAAKSVSYNDGFAGESLDAAFAKLGILEQMKVKTKRTHNSEETIKLVADGEVEIGFTYISELYSGAQGFPPDPNMVPAGTLPKEICPPLTLVGFASSHAKNPEGAKAFLKYMSATAAAPAYKEHHMELR